MRRSNGLWGEVVSWPNLRAAAREAAAGRRRRPSAAVFLAREDEELATLREGLLARTYRPGSYREFTVTDPKPRWISAAPFRDRVVHHALCRVIEPVMDRTLIADTCACRRGKGTHAAVLRAHGHLRETAWCLRLDVLKYFPNVDHALLRRELVRHVKDEGVLWLCGTILDRSPPPPPSAPPQFFPGDDLFTAAERRRGLPVGNLTSQLWANLYLSPLDHFVTERLGLGRYVRYVDDILVFHERKEALRDARDSIGSFLAGLRLRLHPRKTQIVPCARGLPFLGFQLLPSHRRVAFEGKVRCRRRLRRLARAYAAGRIGRDDVNASWNAWVGHARWAATRRLRQRLLGEVLFRREVAMA